MTKHLVLDIETLGVEYGSTVLSIGAVCSDREFYVNNIVTHVYGGDIDHDTVKWWMTVPSETARKELYSQGGNNAMCDVLDDFVRFIEIVQPDYFWGNSPDFDFGHMEYWLKKHHKLVPWKYHQLRDIRTIKDFVDPEKVAEIKAKYTPHIAIEDAKCEYEILQEFLKSVQIGNENC